MNTNYLLTELFADKVTVVAKDGWAKQKQERKLLENLTPREMEVLSLLSKGYINQEITDHLVISRNTVKSHVSNILGKLGVSDRTNAALLAAAP